MYQQMVKEQRKRQSPVRSRSPSSTSSRKRGRDDAPEDMEVVYNAHKLVQSFDTATVRTAQKSLCSRDLTVSVVAHEYLDRLQDFQQSLRNLGFADHPGITAMGIMQANLMLEQVLHMTLFVQALQRKSEDRR